LSLIEDDFNISEVAALDADADGHVLRVAIRPLAENVVVQFHSPLYDEKDLLRRVVLPIKRIVLVDLHLTEQGEHLPYELLVFVVEKANLSDDLTVGVGHDLRFEIGRQLINQLFLVKLLQVLIMIVLQEAPDFLLYLRR